MDQRRNDVLLRLKRIEGQVRGLAKMIERGSPCLEVLTQVGAVTAAMKQVGVVVLEAYMEECLTKESSDQKEMRDTLRDLHKALSRHITWS